MFINIVFKKYNFEMCNLFHRKTVLIIGIYCLHKNPTKLNFKMKRIKTRNSSNTDYLISLWTQMDVLVDIKGVGEKMRNMKIRPPSCCYVMTSTSNQ